MSIKSGQAAAGSFVTVNGTGLLTAATGTPTGTLHVNGVANGASLTVTGANPYKWAVTLPALSAGDIVQVYITATISAVNSGGFVWAEVADTKRVSDLVDAAAAPSASAIDTQLSGTHGAGQWGGSAGSGAISKTLTIDDGTTVLDGVFVWVTSDIGGASTVASGYTDSLGHVTFMLDAGTYYVWCQRAGMMAAGPITEVWS
jgi:hypothetical protein